MAGILQQKHLKFVPQNTKGGCCWTPSTEFVLSKRKHKPGGLKKCALSGCPATGWRQPNSAHRSALPVPPARGLADPPRSCPESCAGALREALRGGVSLRRALGWGKTRPGIGRGAKRPDVPGVRLDGACALRSRRAAGGRGRGKCGFFASSSPCAGGTSHLPPAP